MTDKKRFWIYILVAFGGGWTLFAAGMLLGGIWYSVLLTAAMLMPLLGVLVSHGGLKRAKTGIGWKPEVVGRGRWYLAAWFGPAVMTVLCGALFFLLFPARFDGSMPRLQAQLDAAAAMGQEVPLSPPLLAVISLFQAISYAPFLNAVFAVGEEAGWRGYLTPYLTKRFGRTGGLVLAGCVWAVWHWPLILFAGYEYGAGYPGAPYTGLLLMCVGCTALGTLLSFLYEKADSVWAPALAHGAINAAAGLSLMPLPTDVTSLFPGPTPFGLVAGVPVYALAVLVLLRGGKDTLAPAGEGCYTAGGSPEKEGTE